MPAQSILVIIYQTAVSVFEYHRRLGKIAIAVVARQGERGTGVFQEGAARSPKSYLVQLLDQRERLVIVTKIDGFVTASSSSSVLIRPAPLVHVGRCLRRKYFRNFMFGEINWISDFGLKINFLKVKCKNVFFKLTQSNSELVFMPTCERLTHVT